MIYTGGPIPVNLEIIPDEVDGTKVPDEYKSVRRDYLVSGQTSKIIVVSSK